MEPFREMTVSDLMAELREMPQHRPVTIIVNGMAGVITGVWQQPLTRESGDAPHVLIGEREQADAIVPPLWTSRHSDQAGGSAT